MFDLPASTIVNRNIPKNSFEDYANSKQKKVLTNTISKIRWINKLSTQTINLEGKEVKEIQIIEITLKLKESIADIINVIDRVIPYHIIFIIRFEDDIQFCASQKHIHPTNENQAVIDWTFSSDWCQSDIIPFRLNLQQNLDFVFSDLCFQFSGKQFNSHTDIETLIALEQQKKQLTDQIQKLESAIKNAKKFSKKVELNLELQKCKSVLDSIN